MTARRLRQNARFVLTLALMTVAGVAAAAYVLLHERLPNPFTSTYTLKVAFPSADGAVPGLGQPVNVAGVQAGSITGFRLADGRAVLTLTMQRHSLARLYANATATLDPITPLGDLELNLDPGRPAARVLAPGAMLSALGNSPVPLSTLLSSLDTDSRDFLTSLITSTGQATHHRSGDLRQALLALGPTVSQVRSVTAALARRRTMLARLVHNLAIVTQAASQDDQLATVVKSGDQVLHAVASQSGALQQAVKHLPATLGQTATALTNAASFADQLRPTATALLPGIRGLPHTLTQTRPFATEATALVSRQIRPLVSAASPVLQSLALATPHLSAITPALTSALQTANYALNELAYNPGGRDQGFLYWTDWTGHVWNSASSFGDANGEWVRAGVFVSCRQLSDLGGTLDSVYSAALGVASLCPTSR